jgi:GTP-binding protein YchF
MRLGIFGFPQVGKTTIFNLLTGAHEATGGAHRADANMGVARLPDPRLDGLSAIFTPKKTTRASFECVDIVGLHRGKASSSMNLAVLKPVEALAHVVRAFEDELVPHEEGPVDPTRDFENMELELILADAESARKRVKRLHQDIAKAGRAEDKKELPIQEQVMAWLEAGKPIREMEIPDNDQKLLRGFAYYSAKPLLIVLNVGEEAVGDLPAALRASGLGGELRRGVGIVAASAKIEQEMADLSEADAAVFRSDLGLRESALIRMLHAAYDLLGLISFYTVSEKECRAWPVPRDSTALTAAGAVHTDFAKGFIRAEVAPYEKFVKAGSFATGREHGWVRLEGKEYVVKDGDVIHFRFAL